MSRDKPVPTPTPSTPHGSAQGAAPPPRAATGVDDTLSGYHDSSRDLASGLVVIDGTVSALPDDLKQALVRLRQGLPPR